MYQLVPYEGFKSESGKGKKYPEDTTLETWSPMKENDIQHGFIKRGLEIVAIMNAVLLFVSATDVFHKVRLHIYDFEDETEEDLTIFVKTTAVIGILVGVLQMVTSTYTLLYDTGFKLWCILHLLFAACLASAFSCAISSRLDRTSSGFRFLYFVVIDGVFALTAASIGLASVSPPKSVVLYI